MKATILTRMIHSRGFSLGVTFVVLVCACAYVLRQKLLLWAWLNEQITSVHPSPPFSSHDWVEFLTPLSVLPPHSFLRSAPVKQPLL